jgi:hypothetical protein
MNVATPHHCITGYQSRGIVQRRLAGVAFGQERSVTSDSFRVPISLDKTGELHSFNQQERNASPI